MQYLKKQNKVQKIVLLAILLVLGLGICVYAFVRDLDTEQELSNTAQEQASSDIYEITKLDVMTEYENPIMIDVAADSEVGVRIEEAGDYVLSGVSEEAITIDAQEQIVHLILNGVDVRSVEGPAIHVVSAGKVIITLAENTENVIRDSGNYKNNEKCNAAIYSTCDLTINGEGSLFVYGYYKDAIHTKDLLKIIGGNVYLQAKRNGLRGNDGMVVMPNILTIESEGSGLQTTNANQEGKGMLSICGGDISITTGEYGMVSVADVHIADCSISCLSVMPEIKADGEEVVEEGCFLYE